MDLLFVRSRLVSSRRQHVLVSITKPIRCASDVKDTVAASHPSNDPFPREPLVCFLAWIPWIISFETQRSSSSEGSDNTIIDVNDIVSTSRLSNSPSLSGVNDVHLRGHPRLSASRFSEAVKGILVDILGCRSRVQASSWIPSYQQPPDPREFIIIITTRIS